MTNTNELRDRWQAHLRLAEEERDQLRVTYHPARMVTLYGDGEPRRVLMGAWQSIEMTISI